MTCRAEVILTAHTYDLMKDMLANKTTRTDKQELKEISETLRMKFRLNSLKSLFPQMRLHGKL